MRKEKANCYNLVGMVKHAQCSLTNQKSRLILCGGLRVAACVDSFAPARQVTTYVFHWKTMADCIATQLMETFSLIYIWLVFNH